MTRTDHITLIIGHKRMNWTTQSLFQELGAGKCLARVLEWGAIAFSVLVCEMSAIVWWFEHSLALPFFGIGMKTDLFQSCGQRLVLWAQAVCQGLHRQQETGAHRGHLPLG